MNADAIIGRRTLVWIVGLGGLSFVAAVVLVIWADLLLPIRTVAANSYSRSAIGHQALQRMLQALDVPVIVSRNASHDKAVGADVLVVAEPPNDPADKEMLELLLEAERVLLVLPKWYASPMPGNARWAGEIAPVGKSDATDVLRAVLPSGVVHRFDDPVTWLPHRFRAAPELDRPQLMTGTGMTVLIASADGVLLGEVDRGYQRIWVLSDPDLLSNHGLKRGDNALLAADIINILRRDRGGVVIDEAIHGYQQKPDLWRLLFEFPFILVTINGFAAVAVLLWAATGRFGAPIPAPPPVRIGKTTLIDTAAQLIEFGGHGAETLRRYRKAVVDDVARRVHAPMNEGPDEVFAWLDRVGASRRVRPACSALWRSVEQVIEQRREPDRLVRAARELNRWKQEMLHGSGKSPGR